MAALKKRDILYEWSPTPSLNFHFDIKKLKNYFKGNVPFIRIARQIQWAFLTQHLSH